MHPSRSPASQSCSLWFQAFCSWGSGCCPRGSGWFYVYRRVSHYKDSLLSKTNPAPSLVIFYAIFYRVFSSVRRLLFVQISSNKRATSLPGAVRACDCIWGRAVLQRQSIGCVNSCKQPSTANIEEWRGCSCWLPCRAQMGRSFLSICEHNF